MTSRHCVCALLALAIGSLVYADAPPVLPPATQPEEKAAPAEESKPTPLMALLDKWSLAKPLNDAGITITGSVEAGYSYNTSSSAKEIPGRYFDFESQDPTLNGIYLVINRDTDASKPWDTGGRISWLWGGDARLQHANGLFDHYGADDGPDEQFDLVEAYVETVVPVGKGLKLKIGKWITPLGYEGISPSARPFYSTSFLLNIVPTTHTGVLATYEINDKWSVSAGFSRGWDQALEDNNGDALDFIGAATYKLSEKTSMTFVMTVGPERDADSSHYRTALDYYITHQCTEATSLALDLTYIYDSADGQDGDASHVYGAAGYISHVVCPMLTLNGRVEWFDDTSRTDGFDTVAYEGTLGAAITPVPSSDLWQNLKIRPEIRWDYAEQAIFDGDHSQLTLGIDAYFTF